jgi:hypothetical protein
MTQALAARASVEWLMVADSHGRDLLTLADVLRPPEWHRLAACRGVGTAVFMPGRGGSTALAKGLCIGCPVRLTCLAFALEDPEIDGVWGGTTKIERGRMRGAVA